MMRLSRHPRRAGLGRRSLPAVMVTLLAVPLTVSLAGASPASHLVDAAVPIAALGPVTTGTSCTPSCDLWAETGTMPQSALPGAPAAGVPVYGYNTSNVAVAAPGGPTLVVNQGDAVSITLHNVNLPSSTSLMIAEQSGVIPDTTGTTAGSSKTYTFAAGALAPGTYLYEAGLTPDGPRQVAMGLYGALIVRPTGAPLQAYADVSTAFDDEAVLVLSEIDPAFNASPTTADLGKFAPKFWLINGKAYPNTDLIATDVNHKVLLRYVNAGLQHHSMSLLGLHETIVATEGKPAAHQSKVVAETIPTGTSLDTIVTMPATTPAKYAVFDAAMHVDNDGVASTPAAANPAYTPISYGGMLAFLTVGTGTTGASGPVTSAVGLSPNPTNGSAAVTLTATISAGATAAEYFVDALGVSGAGCAIGAPNVSATIPVTGATAPCADLTTLSSGTHTFYVHGTDGTTWGAFASATLNLDKTGPTISGMTLIPSQTNGTVDVQLQATASDVATGNQNVTAAEYFIDPVGTPAGGTGTPFTVASATTVSLSATLSAATVTALPQGNHTVSVRAQDALGNWGALSPLTLAVDKSAPITSGVSTTPLGPTNGSFGVQFGTGSNGNLFYQRVDATVSDASSGGLNIVAAEYFYDTDPGVGRAASMDPTDGSFDSPTEAVVFPTPIVTVAGLADGVHTIYVRGKDAAGNWGATSFTTLVVDKTAPTVSGFTLTPSVTNNSAVAISATATDPVVGGVNSPIAAAEYFIDAIGAAGTGTALTLVTPNATSTGLTGTISPATVAALTNGTHTVYIRAEDAATNWSTLSSAVLRIDRTPPTFTSITLSPNSIGVGTASVNLTVNGAADTGGSTVTGGEYWICPPTCANPAAGSATAFTLPGTVIIPTGSLLVGQQYTVRARIHDGVGNWSTGTNGIRSAVLTITPVNNIFTDGFESGSLPGNWTSRSTTTTSRLNATAVAAMFGAFGMQAQGNNTNYVQSNLAAAPTYDARFSFNPNNNASTGQDIFAAATSNAFGTQLFHVRYRRNGTQPQVQIQVGNTANAAWVNITNNARNTIEVVWQSGGTLTLYVNGATTPSQSLAAGTGSVAAVRLGSVTSGGSNTLEYFDSFASKSTASPLIGP